MDRIIKDKKFLWVLILGVMVYFQMSWVSGFFHDGYLYAAFGKNAAELGHWLVPHLSESTYPRFFHHTSFIFILEGVFFKIFGSSFTSARLFSGLFPLITGVYLFKFLKSQKKSDLAYIALLIFFIIPPLIKKSRFPNLDLPLMLFFTVSLCSYWKAHLSSSWKDWLMCGFFFGLCALTKGPMSFWVPMIIVLHTSIAKSWRTLASHKPWISFIVGALIFCLWPFSLKLSGNIDIFIKWFEFTFLHTIRDSRGQGSPFYTYFTFLLKNTNVLFILFIFGIFKIFQKKGREDSLLLFVSVVSLVVIISLSFMSFKYSNYLIPVYPFFAIVSGFGLFSIKDSFPGKVLAFFRYLVPIVGLALLIFPLTNVSKRDQELFKTRESLSRINFKPKNWYIYNGVYPFWAMANLNAYIDHTNTYNISKVEDNLDFTRGVFLVSKNDQEKFEGNSSVKTNLKKYIHVKKRNMIIYIPKSIGHLLTL